MKIKLKFDYESLSQEQRSLIDFFMKDAKIHFTGKYESGELDHLIWNIQNPYKFYLYSDTYDYAVAPDNPECAIVEIPYSAVDSANVTDGVVDINSLLLKSDTSFCIYKLKAAESGYRATKVKTLLPASVIPLIGNVENTDKNVFPLSVTATNTSINCSLSRDWSESVLYHYRTPTILLKKDEVSNLIYYKVGVYSLNGEAFVNTAQTRLKVGLTSNGFTVVSLCNASLDNNREWVRSKGINDFSETNIMPTRAIFQCGDNYLVYIQMFAHQNVTDINKDNIDYYYNGVNDYQIYLSSSPTIPQDDSGWDLANYNDCNIAMLNLTTINMDNGEYVSWDPLQ